MGLALIPLTAIFDYTRFYRLPQAQAELFVEVIKRVDAAWMRLANNSQKQSQGHHGQTDL